MRTFAEADAYEVEHRRRRATLPLNCRTQSSAARASDAAHRITALRSISLSVESQSSGSTTACGTACERAFKHLAMLFAGLEEQGVAGKAGADRAIRYLNRAGLDEGSGTSQARLARCAAHTECPGLSERTTLQCMLARRRICRDARVALDKNRSGCR